MASKKKSSKKAAAAAPTPVKQTLTKSGLVGLLAEQNELSRKQAAGVLATLLAWLFPWPAIIVWLFVGTIVLRDVAGMLFGVVTIAVIAWRCAKVYPRWGGLSDHPLSASAAPARSRRSPPGR